MKNLKFILSALVALFALSASASTVNVPFYDFQGRLVTDVESAVEVDLCEDPPGTFVGYVSRGSKTYKRYLTSQVVLTPLPGGGWQSSTCYTSRDYLTSSLGGCVMSTHSYEQFEGCYVGFNSGPY